MAIPEPAAQPQTGDSTLTTQATKEEVPSPPSVERQDNVIEAKPAFNAPGSDHVTVVKGRRDWSYLPGFRLEHNLHWVTGLLELANAGDFAANIWNDTPVPVYAIVFMAIGGTVAAVISVFALRDGGKAWHNVKFLRNQRRVLENERSRHLNESSSAKELDVLVDITRRELYTEIINRWGMDLLMGGGAVLISIGTFMAIGGANKKVFLASNILSGYLGNAPIAVFGLVNFAWATRMWKRKGRHLAAAVDKLQGDQDAVALSAVKSYCFNTRLFFAINGTSTLIGGIGSMLTATQWWAYVILIPVMISSYFCNFWWRRRVGYDRPVLQFPLGISKNALIDALKFSEETRHVIEKSPEAAITQLTSDSGSLSAVLDQFVKYGLFEAFSLVITNNRDVLLSICSEDSVRADITVPGLLALPESCQVIILRLAGSFLRNEGRKHFEHRTRFLAEVLGTFLSMDLCISQQNRDTKEVDVEKGVVQ